METPSACWNTCQHTAMRCSALVLLNAVSIFIIAAHFHLKYVLFTYVASLKCFSHTVIKKWHQHTPKEARSTLSWRGWTSTERLSVVFRVQRLVIKFVALCFFHKGKCAGIDKGIDKESDRWGESASLSCVTRTVINLQRPFDFSAFGAACSPSTCKKRMLCVLHACKLLYHVDN